MAEAQAAQAPPLREYETIYVLRSDVARESAEKIAQRVAEIVDREGGRLTLVETWGRRLLAYPVAKSRRGVYVCLKYLGGGRLVAELERNLRMLDDVIKHMTVQVNNAVDLASVEIDPERIKFEPLELPEEPEEEYSRERELGLEEGAEHHHGGSDRRRVDDELDEEVGGPDESPALEEEEA
jgi:small subunit ribosomal protein S6